LTVTNSASHLLTFLLRFQLAALMLVPSILEAQENPLPDLPEHAELALSEDWSSGTIDSEKWYQLRKKWGNGNNGVVPENVFLSRDLVDGVEKNVLVCRAHGDLYQGEIVGYEGSKSRVGGVIVSKAFFASGRYEVVMKVGDPHPHPGGPAVPTSPSGAIPAVWTYSYRWVSAPEGSQNRFSRSVPMFNPHFSGYAGTANEYWSEIDFPEFGKAGKFDQGLYNTFLQNRHESKSFDVQRAVDGQYHRLTTEWRTHLVPIPDVQDHQVIEAEGVYWIQDPDISFTTYFGNPLKKLNENQYAVYAGLVSSHWIDGQFVGENRNDVPSMAAQLNLGIWLPDWAGPAEWKTAESRFSSIRIWQYNDAGDLHNILTEDITDNFDPLGNPL